MPRPGAKSEQHRLFEMVLAELERLGYAGDLLQRDYTLRDWFAASQPERKVPAAAFGQTPISYDTACIAVIRSNGKAGLDLLTDFRMLGAPLALEVQEDCVIPWRVSRTPSPNDQQPVIVREALRPAFRANKELWSPESILRAKNISKPGPRQLDFVDVGLIPALEEHVRQKLEPLLQGTLATAVQNYKQRRSKRPDARQLFRLAFWSLAGKVFHDRGIREFQSFGRDADCDDVLSAVARHYSQAPPRLLDRVTREVIHDSLWDSLDFRNLSVDVLTYIWSSIFVTDDLRRTLGIHSTPRTVAKYIVDRLPFEAIPERERRVVEPCCGSATFLRAALHRLRDLLPRTLTAEERHDYFKRMLAGFEQEVVGVEISRLSLTLADFPNPNGWQLRDADVFDSAPFLDALRDARVVLCNPPHEDFSSALRLQYRPRSPHKPVELLHRVLDNLHPDAILGFVLPRQILDGHGYKSIREKLVRRFDSIELVSLPEIAFHTADQETTLLLASGPRANGKASAVNHRKVTTSGWRDFELLHVPTREDSERKRISAAAKSLAVPELPEVWAYLGGLPKVVGSLAEVHRGIEWNLPLTEKSPETGKWIETGNRKKLVLSEERTGFREGLPPRASPFHPFQHPPTQYLSMKPEHQRGTAYRLPWDRPKVILNAKRKSRGPWRLAAFADVKGLVCYQTFRAIWPAETSHVGPLAAVLNGPVANALIATREGTRDITNETLASIPVPSLSTAQQQRIDNLIRTFVAASDMDSERKRPDQFEAERILREIDAVVLQAYDFPPRLERELLDFFRGHRRPTPFAFGDYYPADFVPCIPLHEYISDDFKRSTAAELAKRSKPVKSKAAMDALDRTQSIFAGD